MEPCDLQQLISAPVSRRKRSLTTKKSRLNPERPKLIIKKAKKVSSKTVKKKKSPSQKKRVKADGLYPDPEAKEIVMEEVVTVFTRQAIQTPFFIKCMLPSNVSYSFWMIMPKKFCDLHLPSQDATIVLEDESGKEHQTTYLMDRHGLSAGWRGFSMSHKLLMGDILIFNLITPCKFKVNIVRVNDQDVLNAGLCLINLNAIVCGHANQEDNKKRKKGKRYFDATVFEAPRKQVEGEEKCDVVLRTNILDDLNSDGYYFSETAFILKSTP